MDDKKLERIETKIDDLSEHLCTIDITLARQHVTLDEHIRRTELLERDMEPIKLHVAHVSGALKFLLLMGGLSGILEIIRLFR